MTFFFQLEEERKKEDLEIGDWTNSNKNLTEGPTTRPPETMLKESGQGDSNITEKY